MTIQDLHMAVKMELDKNVISSYPSFTEEQIDYFINRAYLMLINQKFTGHNELQSGFEGDKKRIADLNNLIISATIPGSLIDSNEYQFSTDAYKEILYNVSQTVMFQKKDTTIEWRTVIDIRHDMLDKFIHTTTNNPWIPQPVIVFEQDKIRMFVDPVSILDYTGDADMRIEYIKRPTRLQFYIYDTSGNRTPNLTGDDTQIPEIAEHVHSEIVSLTVDLMLDNIESQRIQTHPQLTQIKE